MVNLHSPVLSAKTGLAMEMLWQVMSGIYFWEFFTTLEYEWRVIRGRLPYRWSIWIYSLTRVACLMGVILCDVGYDLGASMNCQLWMSSMATFFCLSLASASLLIVLRIIAIWNKHKVVVVTSIVIWGTGIAFHVNAAVRLRSTWDPLVLDCTFPSTGNVLGLIPTIFADLVLILIMLVGLLLLRRHGSGTFGLATVLWRQAVIWLSLAIVSGTPPAVIAALSTNDQFTDMILSPSLITMTIAATRMHRSLVTYASGFPDVVTAQDNNELQMSSIVFTNIKRAQAALNPSDGAEVTVRTAFEQDTTT
ncbi:hypothetical protein BGY98DRAFT_95060 [Russula aff. rugulosa BPL654]|nr:hypothetical protein BGY98DRAFT_95060 [Russula aff. rugulosa BPL654]